MGEAARDALAVRFVGEIEQQLRDAPVHVEQDQAAHLLIHATQPARQLPQQGEADPRRVLEDALEVFAPQNSPSPSTERMTSRPSSPIRTTLTWPLATT